MSKLGSGSGDDQPAVSGEVKQVKEALNAFEDKLISVLGARAAQDADEVSDTANTVATVANTRFQRAAALAGATGGSGGSTPVVPVTPPPSVLSVYRQNLIAGPVAPSGGPVAPPAPPAPTDALNAESVQSVQFENQEVADYAPTLVAVPPDQMIGQAAGLAAQAAAAYFDGISKIVMASQSIMLKKMAQDVASGNELGAAEDGLVIAETELLLAGAMAVAAAGGAMEAASASFGIQQINNSVNARVSRAAALAAG